MRVQKMQKRVLEENFNKYKHENLFSDDLVVYAGKSCKCRLCIVPGGGWWVGV